MAPQVFGERVHHDVGAVLKRAAQVGAGHCVVYDQRHAVGVCYRRQSGQVGHIAQRVANGLAKHGLGTRINQLAKSGWVGGVGKSGLNAHLGKGVRKQVVGAAVQARA